VGKQEDKLLKIEGEPSAADQGSASPQKQIDQITTWLAV
jgi:hypothetical protein